MRRLSSRSVGGIEYTKVLELKGPLLILEGVTRSAFDELVEISTQSGETRLGKVLEVGGGRAVVQVFEGTTGLSVVGTKSRFLGKTMEMPVSEEVLGRIFDGLGRPLDGLPEPVGE
ncbi:MAG: V-type ATP synthase subunit B, partial [Nitrososphaerales archaeon]